jgi:hypothetical protein
MHSRPSDKICPIHKKPELQSGEDISCIDCPPGEPAHGMGKDMSTSFRQAVGDPPQGFRYD